MKRFKARFIGEDGSLGYKNGEIYNLQMIGMIIQRTDGKGTCTYESLSSFLKNWTDIQTI